MTLSLNKIAYIAILSFFFTPSIYLLTEININFIPFAVVFFLVITGLFIYKINHKIFYGILMYLIFLFSSITIAFFNNITLGNIIKETAYYLKPVLFFLLGYYFISEEKILKISKFLIFWILLMTILFYLNPWFFIHKTMLKVNNFSIYHYYVLNGRFLRNTSLLSPLELSFSLFFLSFVHYKQRAINGKLPAYIISVLLLLTTMTRSAIIAFIVAYSASKIYRKGLLKKVAFLIGLIVLAGFLFLVFKEQLKMLFLIENSAKIHVENLFESLIYIKNNLFGKGIGFSGWVGIETQGEHFYSEGSLFTTIIECGIQFIWIYIFLGIVSFKVSKTKLFPLFIGYIGASFLIPIGFSTLFNLLFFTYFGCLLKQNHISNFEKKRNNLS